MGNFSFFLIGTLLGLGLVQTMATAPEIEPNLLHLGENKANIFISMKVGTNSVLAAISSASFASVNVRRTALHAALVQNAKESQASLLEALRSFKSVKVSSFWITNQIYVRDANSELIELLEHREDVSRVDIEQTVSLAPLFDLQVGFDSDSEDLTPIPFDVEYNLEIIRLTEVWANDVNGTGVVVANIDTGVRASHQALRDSYKNDDYAWFDPVTNTATPVDDHSHGTMTMGVLAGGLEIGVAYGAKWIACKALDSDGQGSQSNLLACGQFVLCPTHPDGNEEDCNHAPQVVSNSWNSQDAGANWYLPVIEAWTTAGIIPVWSAGNFGERGCGSLGSQAPYTSVIAVGSTNEQDKLSWYSSWGPSPFDEDGIDFKPDLAAPGEAVRSAHPQADNTYGRGSGTSLSAPHVAGVIALLLGMNRNLTYTQIKRLLETTSSRDLGFAGVQCLEKPDSEFPNYQFGHGRLDALSAYECVMNEYKCLEEPTTTTATTTPTSTTTTTMTPTSPTTTTTTPTSTTTTTTMPTSTTTTTTMPTSTTTTTTMPTSTTTTTTEEPPSETTVTDEPQSTTPSGATGMLVAVNGITIAILTIAVLV